MKNKTRMMISISILLIASISCQMLTDFLPGGGANPGSFTAEATSPISVQLTWSSVEGAQKYLIERNDGQTDYFPLGEISGETTSFEDFLVSPNTQIAYRIKTVTASGTSGGKTVSLTTPQEFPNPLTVSATFDAQNVQGQAIGPDGGSVSITDSRGVSYTLDIPAGALDNEVTFTLTPIQDIEGLPLSGGMTSGVRIEPEGLIFNQSATLRIETSQPEVAEGMMDMAFAFDGEGSEFHFVPGSSAESTGAVLKLARPASVGSWNVINVPQNRSYGSGRGTSKDIRNQVKNHAPSKPADNLDQKVAASAQDVQNRVSLARFFGGTLEGHVKQITDWESFNETLPDFREFVNIVELDKELQTDEVNEIVDSTWEELITNTHILLELAVWECEKSPNMANAKKLVNQMLNSTSPFYRKFAEKFNKKYGADALKKIKAKLDQCNPGYRVDGPFGETHIFGEICSPLDVPFTLNWDSGVGLAGTMTFSPISENSGTWTLEGAFNPGVTNAGTGSYTIERSTGYAPTAIVIQTGSITQTTVGYGDYVRAIESPIAIKLSQKDCNQP